MELCLLGDFTVRQDGQPLQGLNKPRLQALLAYLALHRDAPQFRYHLAGLLWPESSEAQGQANLRNLVYYLRQALTGSAAQILAAGQTLQWNPDAPLTLDVDELRAIAQSAAPRDLPLEQLERAIQLYRGDLLPSCFEEWIEPVRGQLRQQFLCLLDELIERYEGLRRYDQAITNCCRLVALEPYHAGGYPRLMRLYALAGEAAQAMKTYRDYTRLLKQELGLEPPAEMAALHEHLRAEARRVSRTAGYPPAAAPLPLVGRAEAWCVFQAAWRLACSGSPRLLLVSGEAGIGKTRLTEEMLAWAGRQGMRSAAAHCYASEGALPYAPVVEWLRALRLPPLERAWREELSRLLPELARFGAGRPAPLSEAWQRLRLFEALARAALAGGQKTLLLVEDLHWCDQDSLEWLHYLLRYLPRAPLLVIATARSEEMEANPALGRLAAGLRQEDRLDEIALAPLDAAETGQLASAAAGKCLDSGLQALIYHETEGNPLFIVETVRAELFRQLRMPGVQPLPYKTRAVLENRIAQLSAGARELVGLAATVGREFSLEVLRHALDIPEVALVEGLDELVHRRIANEVAPGVFDFSHHALREAALAGMSQARLRLLHRQVAGALRDLAARGAFHEDKNHEIAYHFEAAGVLDEAFQHYRAAGESARDIFANQMAARCFQKALEMCGTQPAGERRAVAAPEAVSRLYEGLGDALSLCGQYSPAREAFQSALEHCGADEEGGPVDLLRRSSILRRICVTQEAQWLLNEAHASLDQAEQALAGQSPGADPTRGSLEIRREWINVRFARSQLLYWQQRVDEIDTLIAVMQPQVETVGRLDQRIDFLGILLDIAFLRGHWRLDARTVEIARRKVALCSQAGSPYQEGYALFQLGFTLLWAGVLEEAAQALEQAMLQAEKIQAMTMLARSLTYLTICQRMRGLAAEVEPLNERLMELTASIGEENYQGVGWGNRAWLAWRRGELDETQRCARQARAIWQRLPASTPCKWVACFPLLAAHTARGELEQAAGLAGELLDPSCVALTEPLPGLLEQLASPEPGGQSGEDGWRADLLEKITTAAQAAGYL